MPSTSSNTPSPSVASHSSTDSDPIDLTAEDLSGTFTVASSGGSLSCIWDDDHIEFCMVEGKNGWKCKWCGKLFKTRHSTRAMWHLLKIAGNGIATCKSIIPDERLNQYLRLYKHNIGRMVSRKRALVATIDHVVERQTDAVTALAAKSGRRNFNPAPHLPPPLTSGSPTPLPSVTYSKKRRVRLGAMPYNQPSIETSIQRHQQTDINKCNNTELEMAIADFFHCEAIPDVAVEAVRFKRIIKLARLASRDFVIPNRKRVGQALLDLNYENCQRKNKQTLLVDAPVMGLTLLGDGATIHRMPLVNCLALCSDHPPTVLSIDDCTEHMASGGKKDAPYISHLFERHVEEYDPENKLVDLFYFDGASNVQKAGRLLVAKYPRAMCLHGGEHVISLFFADLAKMIPIRVSVNDFHVTFAQLHNDD